ncbi:hypothetical protein FSP39_000284 [Pinctada imbricata]|uniref:Uncharacterized protein n=1 Tax=Pinctada imbricata TaxID=66713 RepID=A0AA88Y671_PINIB|nr:hypothetical protein FSP39_000284 [Pinctada imbricata]
MEPVVSAKIASTAIVLVVTALFGLLPLCILRFLRGRTAQGRAGAVLSYMNCFAGGVFMGTAMLHLLAESEEEVKEALASNNSTSMIEYPITEVAISGGFFLILIMEVVVLRIMSGRSSGSGVHGHAHTNYGTASELTGTQSRDKERRPLLAENQEPVLDDGLEDKLTSSGVHEEVREIIRDDPSVFRSVILVLALSLHMIFEGLAIGLQETQASVWTLLLAVSLHKCIVAFSVGLQMRQILKSTCEFVGFIVVFSVIASMGIPIGLAVTDTYSEGSLTVGILQSVATGTFFYVTFFEILQREFSHCHDFVKLILCLLGYAAIAALKLLDKD